jgi:hypothetical protein
MQSFEATILTKHFDFIAAPARPARFIRLAESPPNLSNR